MQSKVIMITGSSRGIGKAIAMHLASEGHAVFATMRTPKECGWLETMDARAKEQIRLCKLDVTDQTCIDAVVAEILSEKGKIDVVINNAGYGLFAPVELAKIEEVQKQFEVNVYGVLRVIQAVLPSMRQQKSGHVVNISSIAGIVSNPGLGIYSASKHALEAISASLAATVFPWNIKVTVIEPGATATEFAEGMPMGKKLNEPNAYEIFSKNYRQSIADALKEGQDPVEIAELIGRIIRDEAPDFRVQTNENGKKTAKSILVDPTGNQWIEGTREKLSQWLGKGESY